MAEQESDSVALEERLKSALWLAIGRIVDDETIKLGVDATPQFIGALTEMVWAQIGKIPLAFPSSPCHDHERRFQESVISLLISSSETVGQDLEAFAKHAGRSTINLSDVMLLARRNEGLESILRAFVEQEQAKE
ncbi:hypothetical protein ACJ73_00624 [Blastomyces percursus]|uniref:Apoptosis-inducing TAF9-like domain 1 family protein n=1 Tax=Blastomyces percursus TaxID=1658174 RepID=A0A1J9QHK1_9EURO|nr:hypothetical protein ACJ73_00624 [Blastomyces percursus]